MNTLQIRDDFRRELVERIAPFWLENAPDGECGGIFCCLDRAGSVFSYDKGVWMQGRAGWTFSYLYNNVERDERYLTLAKSCIDFALKRCVGEDGRMYLTVTRDGSPLDLQGSDWFSEAFFVSACAEYYKATCDAKYLSLAREWYDKIWELYRAPLGEGKRVMRTFARPMILLNLNYTMREADLQNTDKYNALADILISDIRAFYFDEYHATLESIDRDGHVVLESATCRIVNPGHDIECSWFLLDEGIRRNDKSIIAFAQQMFDSAYSMGLDKEYGGILYNMDMLGAPVESYSHDMKIWWVHNETVIASLMLYLHTGEEKYKDIFDEMRDYSFSHFADTEYPEWYATLHRDGTPTATTLKGFIYKGPFHVPRMFAKCIKVIEESLK